MENVKGLTPAIEAFDFGGEVAGAVRYGQGHINDTFAVYIQTQQGDSKRFILQRINTDVFKNPKEVMANIVSVTEYLKDIIVSAGGDPERETMTVIKTKTNENFYTDSFGGVWRSFIFVENTICLQKVEKPENFYNSAKSFGKFMNMLENYPADSLFETIPLFHDTRNRLKALELAIKQDKSGRAKQVTAEIDFVMQRKADCFYLMDMLDKGEIPLRVTHNDTKLNNILIDENTQLGVCIIDLDTIMPGLSVHDYGDAIRFGASTATEDEQDLSKVNFDISLFEIYTKGYLETAGNALTQAEKDCLAWGAKLMTLECGMRFLTDHIDGDIYFKIHRENHNLDRARTQFKLVKDMEENWDKMQQIIKKYSD